MRKTFLLSEGVFKKPQGLVKELSNYVVDNLGVVYPSLEKSIAHVSEFFLKFGGRSSIYFHVEVTSSR